MKTKDIIALVGSLVIMVVALYFIVTMIFPQKSQPKQVQTVTNTPVVSGQVDSGTLDKVQTFTDYGEGKLENVGRVNPFAPIN